MLNTLVSQAIGPIYQQFDATDMSNRLEIEKRMDGPAESITG
jgi:hypothetical protein